MEPIQKVTIQLSGLRFFGPYGLYPAESKWSIELRIDLSIQFKLLANDVIHLKDTIDYTDIYKTVAFEMNQKHQLLESFASNLIRSLKILDDRIEHCKVRVSKHPQLGGPCDGVAVEVEY